MERTKKCNTCFYYTHSPRNLMLHYCCIHKEEIILFDENAVCDNYAKDDTEIFCEVSHPNKAIAKFKYKDKYYCLECLGQKMIEEGIVQAAEDTEKK